MSVTCLLGISHQLLISTALCALTGTRASMTRLYGHACGHTHNASLRVFQ